jgi:hypothetical protein
LQQQVYGSVALETIPRTAAAAAAAAAAGSKREVTTIYEVVEDADGAVYALPDYQFTYGNTTKYKGPKTDSCVPSSGSIPDSNVAVPWKHGFKYAPGKAQNQRRRCQLQYSLLADNLTQAGNR